MQISTSPMNCHLNAVDASGSDPESRVVRRNTGRVSQGLREGSILRTIQRPYRNQPKRCWSTFNRE